MFDKNVKKKFFYFNEIIRSGSELVKQNCFAKIYGHSVEKGLAQTKNVFGFANHFMKNAKSFN